MKKVKKLIQQMRYIFDRGQKVQLILLLLVVIFTTFVELVGVTALMPIIEVMMDPECIQTTSYLNFLYQFFGFHSAVSFLIFLSAALIVIYWTKNILTVLSYNLQYKFTFSNQKKLAYKMLECYLSQPYYFHLSNNSAELVRSINTDIVMMFQGILSMLQFMAEIMVCLVLGGYLLFKDPPVSYTHLRAHET